MSDRNVSEKSAQTFGLVMMFVFIAVGYLGHAFLVHMQAGSQRFECTFHRQPDVMYVANAHELEKESSLITVYRDGRTFMFTRLDLLTCRSIRQ